MKTLIFVTIVVAVSMLAAVQVLAADPCACTVSCCLGDAGVDGPCYAGEGGPCNAGLGGPAYAGLGGPAYAGLGGPCYAGPGGPCSSSPGEGWKCPSVCMQKCIVAASRISDLDTGDLSSARVGKPAPPAEPN